MLIEARIRVLSFGFGEGGESAWKEARGDADQFLFLVTWVKWVGLVCENSSGVCVCVCVFLI
jgi:hypothetical protein